MACCDNCNIGSCIAFYNCQFLPNYFPTWWGRIIPWCFNKLVVTYKLIDILMGDHRLQSEHCPERNPVKRNVTYSVPDLGFHRKYYQSLETVHTTSPKEILTYTLGFRDTHTPTCVIFCSRIFHQLFNCNRRSSCTGYKSLGSFSSQSCRNIHWVFITVFAACWMAYSEYLMVHDGASCILLCLQRLGFHL